MIPMPQADLQNTTRARKSEDRQTHDFVLRVVEGGPRNKYGKARTSCVIANPNVADVDEAQPREGERSPDGIRISSNEALFLRCILQCQCDYGSKPLPELGLPRTIGIVVDYERGSQSLRQQALAEMGQ
jgi:hypothetical protein